jgi:L-glutamine-phosphate cytidylyltransferase
VPVAGAPLLWHLLGGLADAEVDEVVVVCGYRGDQMRERLTACAHRPPLVFVDNPDYAHTGSLIALAVARPWFHDGFCHIDSDLVLRPDLLSEALSVPHEAIAVDSTRTYAEIDWKAEVVDGQLVDLNQQLPPQRTAGEFLGLTLWTAAGAATLADAVQALIDAGRTEVGYEDAMRLAAQRLVVRPLYAATAQWREVDRPADLPAAENLARSCIAGGTDGEGSPLAGKRDRRPDPPATTVSPASSELLLP